MEPSPELLAGLPAVLAVAREGSATRAASALGVTTATVLRRIEAVERELGVALFERLPTGLVAAPALDAVLPWAEQVRLAVSALGREVAGLDARPAGVVRLAVPPVVASHLLLPAVARLRAEHPGVELELAAANAVVDLQDREADLALRVVRPTAGDLVVKKLSDYRVVVACAPSLLAGRPSPSLQSIPWLTWDQRMAQLDEARWLREAVPSADVVLRASDLGTLLAAARRGLGALVVAEPLAALEGGLVRVPTAPLTLPSGSIWLVAHRALRPTPRVAAVWEWIEAHFAGMDEAGALRLSDG